MKKVIIPSLFSFILSMYSLAEAKQLEPGDLFHVTGCENGELLVPVVNMWSEPGNLKIVGVLSGNSKKKCQGAVVKVLQSTEHNGRIFLKVKSIVNSNVGWITDSFVGKKFKKSRCKKYFDDPEQIKRCDASIEIIDKKFVYVGEEGANLYAHPNHSQGFKKIKKGRRLEVLETKEFALPLVTNTWFYVKYKKEEGWVSQHSLEGRPGRFLIKENEKWKEQ